MEYQLRTYRIESGRLEQFIGEWRLIEHAETQLTWAVDGDEPEPA